MCDDKAGSLIVVTSIPITGLGCAKSYLLAAGSSCAAVHHQILLPTSLSTALYHPTFICPRLTLAASRKLNENISHIPSF